MFRIDYSNLPGLAWAGRPEAGWLEKTAKLENGREEKYSHLWHSALVQAKCPWRNDFEFSSVLK